MSTETEPHSIVQNAQKAILNKEKALATSFDKARINNFDDALLAGGPDNHRDWYVEPSSVTQMSKNY